jgi:GNAT superfamily N-acetyltransferase
MIIRNGLPDDHRLTIALFDEAVAWLVERGQPGQWGTEPFSRFPARVQRARDWAESGGLYVAETDAGEPLGIIVLGDHPPHVEPPDREENYVEALVTSRRHQGEDIGGALIRHAIAETRTEHLTLLRVDCWADAPGLVAWYEAQGFTRTSTFDVKGWRGQVLAMAL